MASPIGPCPAGSRLHVQTELHLPLTVGTFIVRANVVSLPPAQGAGAPEAIQLCRSPSLHFFVSNRSAARGIVDLGAKFSSEVHDRERPANP
jgi:hypothetical protein